MILPTKHLSPADSLITIAATITMVAPDYPISSGQLWERTVESRHRAGLITPLSFDWFVLALDFLFVIGRVSQDPGGQLKLAVNDA